MKLTNAELTEQLAGMTKRAIEAEARTQTLAADLVAANGRADEATKARQDAEAAHDATREELRATSASLKAFKGSATKARASAEVLKKQLSPEARPIGAMKPARSEQEDADRTAALEAAFAADTTELVYSDGRREIRELAPLAVTGSAWRQVPSRGQGDLGRVLDHEPLLEPGDCGRETLELRGFGLLNEAGEQVAYQALPEPIVIPRNRLFQLPKGTIRF